MFALKRSAGRKDNGSDNETILNKKRIARPPHVAAVPFIGLRSSEVILAISTFILLAIVAGLVMVLVSTTIAESNYLHSLETTVCHDLTREDRQKADEYAREAERESKRYCLTTRCIHTASRMLELVDLTADPCYDFWSYACGGWRRKGHDANSAPLEGVDQSAEKRFHDKVWSLIEPRRGRCRANDVTTRSDNFSDSNFGFKRKLQTMYSRCMETNSADGVGVDEVNTIVNGFGGWSVFDDWNVDDKSGLWQTQKVLQLLQFSYNIDSLFTIDVSSERLGNNTTSQVIQVKGLRRTDWNLPKQSDYNRSETDSMIVAYKRYMRTVAKLFAVADSKADDFVEATYNFERSLARVHDVNLETGDSGSVSTRQVTVQQLQRIFGRIQWIPYLGHVMKDTAEIATIIIPDSPFLSDLHRLLEETEEEHMNGYLVWRFLSRLAVPFLTKPFRQAFDSYLYKVYGIQPRVRQYFCQSLVEMHFGEALKAVFLSEESSASSFNMVKSMLASTKEALLEKLDQCPWMTDVTRNQCKEKVSSMKFNVGDPFVHNETYADNYYENLRVYPNSSLFDIMVNVIKHQLAKTGEIRDHKDAYETVLHKHSEVDISYSREKNLLSISPQVISKPYFDEDLPAVLHFATLGHAIAREMLHAIDQVGEDVDDGTRKRSYTGGDSMDMFRRYCVGDRQGNSDLDLQTMHEQQVSDEVADIGGFILPYEAYRHWKKPRDQVDERDSSFPLKNFTNEQFFFIRYAQSYCTKHDHVTMETCLKTRSCSSIHVRAPWSTTHADEFVTTFNCTANGTASMVR